MQKCNKEGQGQFGINLAKDIQDNKKGFFQYIKNKKESVSLFLCGTGTIVAEAAEKAEMLNATFASVFTDKTSPQESLAQVQGKPLVEGKLSHGQGG